MSQFVTIQIGQCGNQIGSAFWPLTLHEHGIPTKSGGVHLLKTQTDYVKNMRDLSDGFSSFFDVPKSIDNVCLKSIPDLIAAKVKARAVLIDMEDSVVSRFKQGPLRNLFDHSCMVTNYPGSGNNWAVGYYMHGSNYREKIEEIIRCTVEKCDSLGGFLFLHSLGGGTGSGLGTATLSFVHDMYPQVDRLVSCIYPAGSEDVVTAPYNVLLSTQKLIEHGTCVFPMENRALLDLCLAQVCKGANVDQAKYNASCKPFQDMNSIVVNMLLHLTSGSRFPGMLNVDISDLATNLVPYPQLHYIFSSLSPISLTPTIYNASRSKEKDECFTNVWSRNNQLLKIDPMQPVSKIFAAAYMARGNYSMGDMMRNIEKFQKKGKFTAWSKEAIKIGLCSVPPPGHSVSLLCLLNSSAMTGVFDTVIKQFDRLYQRKAHVHHYTEVNGFEKTEFIESRESVLHLCDKYREIENQKLMEIPRLQLL